MDARRDDAHRVIFWHRELPPLDADAVAEHTLEAASSRVHGAITHGDESWSRCHEDLMATVHARLLQELSRLGGDYAHVVHESIDTRYDNSTDEGSLHGQFAYVLYRRGSGRTA